MSKYNFEKEGNKIIAVSSYAGRPVKGYAKCHPDDKFDEASGRALAKARCNQKVAYKRNKRAFRKLKEAREALAMAQQKYNKMCAYVADSTFALEIANDELLYLEAMAASGSLED